MHPERTEPRLQYLIDKCGSVNYGNGQTSNTTEHRELMQREHELRRKQNFKRAVKDAYIRFNGSDTRY